MEERPLQGASLKFLVVRFSAIGDCVMSVPVAASIRRADPSAEIVWVAEERCFPVIDSQTLVSRRVAYPRERFKQTRWSPTGWREQLAFFARLREAHFDIGIDLQGHAKTAVCLRLASPKKRLAARAIDPLAKLLNPVFPGDDSEVHTVDWNLRALANLGEFPTETRWIMPKLPPSPVATNRPVVAITVGAGHPTKRYPAENWASVAEALQREDFQVVFLGGPGETAPCVSGAINLVDQLPLEKTMAVIAGASVHLGADTGGGHIAAAYGVPTVTVFGPKSPAQFAPYQAKRVVLRRSDHPEDVTVSEVIQGALAIARRGAMATKERG